MYKKKKDYNVKFETYTYGGEVMGRLEDGRAVFTPFVMAEEEARIHLVVDKKRFVKGKKLALISSSEARITPKCAHFEVCGGCHYQHISYGDQLKIKEQIVFDQLTRLGGFENPNIAPIVPSDEPFYYRNTVQFHVADNGSTGFLSAFDYQVVPLKECHLPHTAILDLWQQLDLETYPGLKKVHFRCGAEDDLMVILESEQHDQLPTMALDIPVSVVHLSPAGAIVMAGDDHLVMQVKEKLFKVSAQSFFQVNTDQAKKMVDLVLKYIPERGGRLIELYSGVGLFTAFLAPRFEEVVAIESSESACEDFASNLDEYDHISLYMGDVKDILPGIEGNADVVLVDPPRSGLQPEVLDAIVTRQPKTLVYVSCDPATLARDAKRFAEQGYTLEEVTPVDMFPQTYHIETIMLMTNGTSDAKE